MKALATRRRSGATTVEFALVLPVFITFVFGIVECGRMHMTVNVLKNACRQGSRYGSTEGVSTAGATARVNQILAPAMDTNSVSIIVKNASTFDEDGELPQSASECQSMSDIELSTAEPRQLFLIRAEVAYNDIALIPMPYLNGVVLSGQVFMRHE